MQLITLALKHVKQRDNDRRGDHLIFMGGVGHRNWILQKRNRLDCGKRYKIYLIALKTKNTYAEEISICSKGIFFHPYIIKTLLP